ncbi:unnamed protein product, partial [marine sediment metagenome]
MTAFTDYVQLELPFRTAINVIETVGTLLVKDNNTFSRTYIALSQGTIGRVLTSRGVGFAPTFEVPAAASLYRIQRIEDNTALNVVNRLRADWEPYTEGVDAFYDSCVWVDGMQNRVNLSADVASQADFELASGVDIPDAPLCDGNTSTYYES